MNFDSMTADEVKAYVESTDFDILEGQLSACSFACVKRTYEKYFGCKPVSTMSRSYVQSSFRLAVCQKHRFEVLLG